MALLYRYRWFKLTPNALVYYKRASDAIPGEDPRGVIEFTPGMTVELVPYVGSWIMAGLAACLESGTLYDCCFGSKTTLVITTQNRRLRLECPSQEAAVQWHEAEIRDHGGIEALVEVAKKASSEYAKSRAAGALWQLSQAVLSLIEVSPPGWQLEHGTVECLPVSGKREWSIVAGFQA